ncbi:MAG TPA: tetratricopeptide repeat protein, partial [Rhodocyclaceae bacterium]
MNADLLQGFYLGDLLVDPATGRVTGRSGSSHLPSKAVEVLLCLASSPGQLVSRRKLIATVWGEGRGSDEALSHAVSEIRHALGDHHEQPVFIQTLPKRGYRLLLDPDPVIAGNSTIIKNGGPVRDLSLLDNLVQRGVIETGVAYLIFGWLLIQVADIVFDQLHFPDWAGTFVTLLVIAGFPIALLLSWFLEIRGGNAVLDRVTPKNARRRRVSRTYVSVISAFAIAAVAVFAYDRTVGLPQARPVADAQPGPEVVLPPIEEHSLAVLPFLNLDGSDETAVFANGLVDDVLTSLARVPGLLVASRGDAYSLEPNSPSKKVRERLRVARYVEGSVQITDDRIRVIVQLIDSETGFHVMSRSFDRPREDFFDIRDEVTSLTVANMRPALPPKTRMAEVQTVDDPALDVYMLYRRGVDASRRPTTAETITESLDWFDRALAIDPDYAAAHAGKCNTYAIGYPETDDAEFIAKAEASCARALALNPNLDVVHTSLGLLYVSTGRYDAAIEAYSRALDTDPSNVDALLGLGDAYR